MRSGRARVDLSQGSRLRHRGTCEAARAPGLFTELGPERTTQLEAVSLDLGPAFHESVTKTAPKAMICADPYHVVALANRAVDTVCRGIWQAAEEATDESRSAG